MAEFNAVKAIETLINSKTDEERAEWDKFQAEEREKLSDVLKIQTDPRYQKVRFGLKAIELSEEALKHELTGHRRMFERTRLAEGYALSGDLEKAIELTPDKLKKSEYEATLSAIKAKSGEWCNCPKQKGAKFLKERVYYHPSNRFYNIMACGTCGYANTE